MHPIDSLAQPLLYATITFLVILGVSVLNDLFCLHSWRPRHQHQSGPSPHYCNKCCRKNRLKSPHRENQFR